MEIFNVEVNVLAIALAMVANMAVGAIWYSPLMFSNLWIKLMGKKREEFIMTTQDLMLALINAGILAVGLNSVLQYSRMLSGLDVIPNMILTPFTCATTFSAYILINNVIWEGKSYKLAALNYAHTLVTMIAMCTVLEIFI